MTTLNVTNLKNASSSTNNLVLNSNGSVTGAGKILQYQQSTKTDTASTTSGSHVDIPGTDQDGSGSVFCVKITPSSSSNKVMLHWLMSNCNDVGSGSLQLFRDSTQIHMGDDLSDNSTRGLGEGGNAGGTVFNTSGMFIDSPNTTSEVTYKFKWAKISGNYTFWFNRNSYGNYSYRHLTQSTMIAMELSS